MAVTVISEPGLISLSKNPCEFHLRTDSWVNQQPVAGVYELSFTTKLATLGSTLTLTWNGNEVVFYVQATGVTATGYNLPQDIAATTLAQYVEQLASDFFTAQYLLQKDFEIEYDATGPLIRFTAKEPGTELELTYSTTIPSGEATMATATAAVAWGYLDDYAIIMDVEVETVYNSGNYVRVGTLHGKPTLYDDSGTWKGDAKLDVQELLDGFLQDAQDRPNIGTPTSTLANATSLAWRVVWAERYTVVDEAVYVRRTQSDNKQVIKGGLKHLDVPSLGDLETNFYGAALKPWQTWQPDGKEVTQDEQHWLYFKTPYQITGADYYELTAEVFYTDGTTATSVINTNAVQQKWETYYYRVGFVDEALDTLNPTKTPYKYTVQLTETSGGLTSELVTFWLVDGTRQDRFYLFENSIGGGFDTLRCNGDMQALVNVSKTEAVDMLQAGYDSKDAITKVKSQGYGNSFEVFSGFKPRAEIEYLRDFLNSENVYEIIDGALIPIVVNSGQTFKLEHEKTGEYGYGLSFSYRQAFINKGYSNA